MRVFLISAVGLIVLGMAVEVTGHESLWIEAERLDGVRGYCWPMGRPEMKKTSGHWGLSGPGWAAEWNMGGESGFLSIATAADDDKAVATKTVEIPVAGRYFVWVRYGDCWLDDATVHPSQLFRFRPIRLDGGRALATAPDGKVFCAAYDRGRGRLIYLSVPHGLGIDRRAVPVVARLFAHLTRGLMPIEVNGDVKWMVNHTENGWLVTLLNPAGQRMPQQGITPTDFRENRLVTITSRVPITSARDRLLTDDQLVVEDNTVRCEVSAGGVRIVELR